MKSSIQVQNEIRACDDRIDELSAKFNVAEDDAKAAIHDEICEIKGQKKSLYDMLPDIQQAEDEVRKQGGVPLAAGTPEPKKAANSVADVLMAQLNGGVLGFNQMLSYSIKDAGSTLPYTNVGLPGVEQIDYTLPRQTTDSAFQFGFVDSLPKATTNADSLTFFVKDDSKYKNAADTWTAGTQKPSSAMGFTQETVNIETIAHLFPVLEQQLKDNGQFANILNVEMLNGLRLKEAEKAISGNNKNGITGIVNNTSIQTYTADSKDDLVDSIRKMKTDIVLATGYNPTHVAMHPFVAESLELMKDKNGRYILQVINGKLWALQVTEDINLATTSTSSGTSTTTYGALVYWNGAATWFTKETDAVTLGLVGNQFAYNEATLRAEGRHALEVRYPKAFSYLADTGVTGR